MTTMALVGIVVVIQTMTFLVACFIAAMVSKVLDYVEQERTEEL